MNEDIENEKIENKIKELSPSSKLVIKVLEIEGNLTAKEITQQTRLPQSTTHYALKQLLEKELISVAQSEKGLIYELKI